MALQTLTKMVQAVVASLRGERADITTLEAKVEALEVRVKTVEQTLPKKVNTLR